MTTKKQVHANRKNAARSTGPRSRAGKAASSKNAVTHGVLSKEIVLPTEDVEEFEELSDGFHRSLAPAGTLEEQLVRMIVVESWRVKRVYRIEARPTLRTHVTRKPHFGRTCLRPMTGFPPETGRKVSHSTATGN